MVLRPKRHVRMPVRNDVLCHIVLSYSSRARAAEPAGVARTNRTTDLKTYAEGTTRHDAAIRDDNARLPAPSFDPRLHLVCIGKHVDAEMGEYRDILAADGEQATWNHEVEVVSFHST